MDCDSESVESVERCAHCAGDGWAPTRDGWDHCAWCYGTTIALPWDATLDQIAIAAALRLTLPERPR
jgi:hypothetical protein